MPKQIIVIETPVLVKINALRANLKAQFPATIRKVQEAAAVPAISAAKALAPVDTGSLRREIQIINFRRSKATFVGPKVYRGRKLRGKLRRSSAGFRNPFYALIVERGSTGRNAFSGRHYMRRAYTASRAYSQRLLINGLDRELRKVLRSKGLL